MYHTRGNQEETEETGTGAIFPVYRHHSFRRLRLRIRDWELGSCNHPRRERAVPLLNQEGSPSARPSALAACGAEHPPVFLCASVPPW